MINLDDCKSIRTHWIALYVNGNNITYFDSFGVEHIPKEIKKFKRNENIATNIYRIQASIQFNNVQIFLYWICIGKYIKFEDPKILHIFKNPLVVSIICSKCENEDEKYVKKKNQYKNIVRR